MKDALDSVRSPSMAQPTPRSRLRVQFGTIERNSSRFSSRSVSVRASSQAVRPASNPSWDEPTSQQSLEAHRERGPSLRRSCEWPGQQIEAGCMRAALEAKATVKEVICRSQIRSTLDFASRLQQRGFAFEQLGRRLRSRRYGYAPLHPYPEAAQ